MGERLSQLKGDVDFKALVNKYESPNCYSIIVNLEEEKFHSKFIKWLLDPKENHNLGKLPLSFFISLVASKKDEKIENYDYYLEGMELKREVKTESKRGRVDIVGENDLIVLVIENKIKAKETISDGKYQTDRYFEDYEKESFANKKKYYVYLNPNPNIKPHNKNFTLVTYQEFYDKVILPCINNENIKLETKYILEQYSIAISKTGALGGHNIQIEKDLLKEIYTKYSDVLECIRKEIDSNKSEKKSEIYNFWNEYKEYINKILNANGKEIIIEEILSCKGNDYLKKLCNKKIITPGKTELIYKKTIHDDETGKQHVATYVIQIFVETGMCYCMSGYYDETRFGNEYTGQEEIDNDDKYQYIAEQENGDYRFKTIDAAAKAVENLFFDQSNHLMGQKRQGSGIPRGLFKVRFSDRADVEGKRLREIDNLGLLQ